jgi:hypothetical protein
MGVRHEPVVMPDKVREPTFHNLSDYSIIIHSLGVSCLPAHYCAWLTQYKCSIPRRVFGFIIETPNTDHLTLLFEGGRAVSSFQRKNVSPGQRPHTE